LVGNEGHRLEEVFGDVSNVTGKCILPPYPRKMGTYIPNKLENNAYELKDVSFTDNLQDTHTAIALETARELGLNKIYIVGYDGYAGASMGQKEQELFAENEYLFEKAKTSGLELISLTATSYSALRKDSVFARL
jgi:4-hydroxy 2-oxovalerate aldolase